MAGLLTSRLLVLLEDTQDARSNRAISHWVTGDKNKTLTPRKDVDLGGVGVGSIPTSPSCPGGRGDVKHMYQSY